MKKVELLAPAGSYESFLGAIHAGADAVYLGGNKYGARAFAENFDEETLCKAIFYAHLFDRKVYLTLNTLMKQSELEDVTEFIMPFYLAGLDGVIVQDLGLAKREARISGASTNSPEIKQARDNFYSGAQHFIDKICKRIKNKTGEELVLNVFFNLIYDKNGKFKKFEFSEAKVQSQSSKNIF